MATGVDKAADTIRGRRTNRIDYRLLNERGQRRSCSLGNALSAISDDDIREMDDDALDQVKEQMEDERRAVAERKKELRRQEVRELRDALAKEREELTDLEMRSDFEVRPEMSVTVGHRKIRSDQDGGTRPKVVNIEQLRNMDVLKEKVDRLMVSTVGGVDKPPIQVKQAGKHNSNYVSDSAGSVCGVPISRLTKEKSSTFQTPGVSRHLKARRRRSRRQQKLLLFSKQPGCNESSSDSNSCDIISDFDSADDVGHASQKTKHVKSSKIKSGKSRMLTDSVIKEELWPHTGLKFSYGCNNVSYDKLDINLFVAGYVNNILIAKTPSSMVSFKLKHLEKLMYFSRMHSWGSCLAYNEAVFTEIERGHKSWESSFMDLEFVLRFGSQANNTSNNSYNNFQPRSNYNRKGPVSTAVSSTASVSSKPRDNGIWYCSKFNRGQCTLGPSHSQYFFTDKVTRIVEHFCSHCMQMDGSKKQHSFMDCPVKG